MYACTYRLFAGTWRPLVSVITTLYYVAIIFHRRVWNCALSLRYACIGSSGIILIPRATFVPNFVFLAASIAVLAHGEKSRTHSITHSLTHPAYFAAPGTGACASEFIKLNIQSHNLSFLKVICTSKRVVFNEIILYKNLGDAPPVLPGSAAPVDNCGHESPLQSSVIFMQTNISIA